MARILKVALSLVYVAASTVRPKVRGNSPHDRRAWPVVLTYHAVGEADLAGFESQIRRLSRFASTVFANSRLFGTGDNRPRVAVTFDDAFQHVFDQCLPILARYRMPGTVFVPTGYLGTAPGWMASSSSNGGPDRVVTQDVLERIDPRYVRLGSHTVTHARLAALDEARLRRELAGSRTTLERITGHTVDMLALPYGSYSPDVIEAARAAGYAHVFANVPITHGRVDALLTGRTDVSPNDWPLEFWLKAHGGYQWMAFAVPAKRRLLRWLGRPSAN